MACQKQNQSCMLCPTIVQSSWNHVVWTTDAIYLSSGKEKKPNRKTSDSEEHLTRHLFALSCYVSRLFFIHFLSRENVVWESREHLFLTWHSWRFSLFLCSASHEKWYEEVRIKHGHHAWAVKQNGSSLCQQQLPVNVFMIFSVENSCFAFGGNISLVNCVQNV